MTVENNARPVVEHVYWVELKKIISQIIYMPTFFGVLGDGQYRLFFFQHKNCFVWWMLNLEENN